MATNLLALIQASPILEFKDADYNLPASSAVITATSANDSDVPYTFSTSASGGGTFVKAVTQQATGHEWWSEPKNWTLGRIPAGSCLPPVQAAPSAGSGGSLVDTTTYYWVVTAINANGETTKSNQETLTISAPNQTAHLSWAAVPGATGYKVYRSTTTNVYTTPALVATLGTVLLYADTGTAVATGDVPGSNTAAGDDIYLSQSSSSLKYGLPSDYLTPASLHVDTTFTGQAGLPDQNVAGYFEYRPTYMQMAPAAIYFGENGGTNGGSGCPLFRLDKGTVAVVATICYQTGSPASQGLPALWIKGANAADTYVLQQGIIGLAVDPGDTAQFSTMKVGYQSNPATDVQLLLGAGCVCGDIEQLGGIVNCSGNVTTLTMTSGGQGSFYLNGMATMGTATIDGGTYFPKTTGTHTTVDVNDGGTLDHRQDIRAFVITTLTLSDGCTFFDPAGTINFSGTNALIYNGNPAST